MGLAINILAGTVEGVILALWIAALLSGRLSKTWVVLGFAGYFVLAAAVAVGLSTVQGDPTAIGFTLSFWGAICGAAGLAGLSSRQPEEVSERARSIPSPRSQPSGIRAGLLAIGLLGAYLTSTAVVIWLMGVVHH
jgi:hypothetical protein